tara:strand:- start:2386 stop:4035 length:1650 start_codon:yes stop_codon:yes gene_type:complete
MCGIFAILYSKYSDLNVNLIESSFYIGKKRGPESSHFEILKNNELILGFHRLAINGLNSESDQPIEKYHKKVICNGEIYNYKQLFNEMKISPQTQSDCEVLIDAYEKKGLSFFSSLDGVFSLVMFDSVKNQIVVGRDPYGVRPLYMCYYKNMNIGFSSDIEPLLFDENIYSISPFPPGSYATFSKNKNTWEMLHFEKYFDKCSFISYLPSRHEKPIEYFMYTFVEYLNKAVEKRVDNCEREIACLLSGGLDSSIIAALVSKYYFKKTGSNIETYSIGLNGAEDLKYSSLMADHIKSIHKTVICKENDFFNSIPNVIADIESYDTTTVRASVGNWNIGKYISNNSNAKVIFNGDGADELAGGYLYFNRCPNDEEFHIECLNLLDDINRFDVLRSDKCISSHGLEPRTPFLDRDLTRFYLSIPIELRNQNNLEDDLKCEKFFIRKSIEIYQPNLIPDQILSRRKEAFSDGVSSIDNSWYKIIEKKIVELNLSNVENKYTFNKPQTNEQLYYRKLFELKFGDHCSTIIPYFWLPSFITNSKNDASARELEIY